MRTIDFRESTWTIGRRQRGARDLAHSLANMMSNVSEDTPTSMAGGF